MIVINQDTIQVLFALVRSVISGKQLTEQECALYNQEMLPKLMAISKKHDIAHLVAAGLDLNGLITDEIKEIINESIKAVCRYAQLNCEFIRVCDALENANIPFIPLKGSVICKYYPKPWMRTSSDIDILLHENDLEKAVKYLVENLEYTCNRKGSHDIQLFSKNHLLLELHYTLIGEGEAKSSCEVLNNVWEFVFLQENKAYCYEMKEEMFYFYHIAHLAKHFEIGGCGIRPIIDLWILDNIEGINQNERDNLLKQGGLFEFAEKVRKLGKIWFSGAQYDEITKQMEEYILRGGVYGSLANRVVVQQQKRGGRLKYAFSKIFIPYDVIKLHYPILQKHRWLTPIMEVRRWFKLVFCGHAKRTVNELKVNQNVSKTEAERVQEFLKNIGLL